VELPTQGEGGGPSPQEKVKHLPLQALGFLKCSPMMDATLRWISASTYIAFLGKGFTLLQRIARSLGMFTWSMERSVANRNP
jgi:hypothetical protein